MRGWHQAVTLGKQIVYGSRGEPYQFAGQVLHFVPGTRPIRTRYADSAFAVNRYDALTVLWIEKHLRPTDTAIDIGAHFGVFSLLMAAKSSRVIAFEPDPQAREMLRRNVALNPSLSSPVIEASACSDTEGEAMFYNCHGNTRSALFECSPTAEPMKVKTVTLDGYIAEHDLEASCVKIDAEGAEIRILKGAPKLLASDAAVICELHPTAWTFFSNSFEELRCLVHEAGRRIRYLDHSDELVGDPSYGVVILERLSQTD